jgi:hypothetical protein
MNNPWSKNGVALYPPNYPVVGQVEIFNALTGFRQQFSEQGDLSGFFVLLGDWGLGKTRIGFELIAESVGQIDEWLLDPNRDFIITKNSRRVLEPQFTDHILPLFIDYRSVTEDLAADTWAIKVACNALSLLFDRPAELRVPAKLLDDLKFALNAKGVDMLALQQALQSPGNWKNKIESVMQVLRQQDIRYLWIIVDEIETPGDLKRNPDYVTGKDVDEEDLAMISQVIKEARYRDDCPYINYLLLCSLGMSDAIQIGPNRRRTDLMILEPNRIYDVKTFQNYLKKAGIDVDYPVGTLEGIFIATNRNFGWFNKVMSNIHAIWETDKSNKNQPSTAWELIAKYAQGAASKAEIFNLAILKQMSIVFPKNSSENALSQQMIYGQLPVLIDHSTISTGSIINLLKAEIQGVGNVFTRLQQIHIDAPTLSTELLKPEYGFKRSDKAGDHFYNIFTEFSLSGVLSALRAFSLSVDDENDFVIYEDIDQFAEQLATLYPHDHGQDGKSIERAADPLHDIFIHYADKNKDYIGVSFKVLKKINVKMSVESRAVTFFRDRTLDAKIENYVKSQASSTKSRMEFICKGMAKVIDDGDRAWLHNWSNENGAYVSFESDFRSPMTGLDVTLRGQISVSYCNESNIAKELSELLGKASEALPILVLFGPSGDMEGFQHEIENMQLLKVCVILRKISTFEEEFLLKYSGRDKEFDPNQAPLSSNTLAILGNMRQDLQSQFSSWKQELNRAGLIISPIWAAKNITKEDFYTGYRYLLVNGGDINDLDISICKIPGWSTLKLDNFKTAAKKNVSPGQASTVVLLPILEDESYRPIICKALLQVLRKLHTQASEDNLAKHFFFANHASEVAGKQTTQILELLEVLGLIYRPAPSQYMSITKQRLENQRVTIKTWLQNEAKSLIHDFQDVFPERAKQLEKGFLQMAFTDLTHAESVISEMEFSFIDQGELDPKAFIALVQKVDEFEKTIQKVSPFDPAQQFQCSMEQLKWYQDNYLKISLWEKVHFLKWLRGQYIEKQTQILTSITSQIADVSGYSTIQGEPFPTAPITQVLSVIKNEIQAPIAGGTQTSRGWLTIDEYPQKINQYFLADQYVEAWGRLRKLEELITKTNPNSLWQRYVCQAQAWQTIINYYLQAKEAWGQLNNFLKDAPQAVKNKSKDLDKEFHNFDLLVKGGLEHDIQQQIATKPDLLLLEALETEVSAASKYQGLSGRIAVWIDEIRQSLRTKISTKRLEAVNHALRAVGKSDLVAPQERPTYQQNVDAYESFNIQIESQGKGIFEDKGKKTNWELWVQFYEDLDAGRFKPKPQQEVNIDELLQMGLIERKITLK